MVPGSTVTLLLTLSLLGLLVSDGDSVADMPSRSLFQGDSPALETIARLQAEPNEFLKGQPSAGLKSGPSWGQQEGLQHQQQNQGTRDATAYHSSKRSNEKDSDSPLSFSCTNNYPKVTWSPWSHLAEPYREAKLIADSTVGDPENDIFTWILPSEEGAMREGRILSHIFTSVGKKPVTLIQKVVATGEQFSVESYVMVKYVRREIRELHDEDRELFLHVMEILYRVPTSDGKRIYGEDYKGIDHFVQMHLDGAGTKECDHWHDDAGIVTHHVAYTLLFEQAMQRIAPSISVPYWEYTIESTQNIRNYGESIIFDDNWFGEFSPENEMHTIERGRFAFLPIMKDAWDYVHNSYGLLRTPWNVNPTPFVTRHNLTNNQVPTSMVSCTQFSSCLNSSTLVVMNECLNGLTHGPVHILTGGQWDDREEDFIVKTGYYMLAPLITKFLWRKGYIQLPEHCESDDACVASCPADVYESRGMKEYDVLMDVQALAWMSTLSSGKIAHNSTDGRFYVVGKSVEVQDAFWKKMLRSFCDPGHVGEMYTSAAPYDPVFWVVHPTIERLLAWRRILAIDYPDKWALDETWGYDHSGFVIGDTGVVCDWSNIEQGSTDLPKCVRGICGGHKEFDLLPFLVEINGEVKQYTNAEWMDLIHPYNEDLPYMYDMFNWHHCYEDGYGMGTESSF